MFNIRLFLYGNGQQQTYFVAHAIELIGSMHAKFLASTLISE